MTQPHEYDYLSQLEKAVHVGNRVADDVTELGRAIARRWVTLENKVQFCGYDVLEGHNWTFHRGHVQELLVMLYQLPDASSAADIAQIREKDREYGASWIMRGGVGAFFSAVRKWDRIVNQVRRHGGSLWAAIQADQREEGILDDLGDLRRYLVLWEAWWMAKERHQP